MANRKKSTWGTINKFKTVKKCKLCGVRFDTTQGNRKYCEKCMAHIKKNDEYLIKIFR